MLRAEDSRLKVAWSGVAVGGVVTFVISAAVVLLVLPFFTPWATYMDPIVVVGVASVVTSVLRAMAGIFAGRFFRARFVVNDRTDYLLTGALAGALGWLLWALVLLALGDAQLFTTTRGLLELPRWMVEVALGSLLVSVDPPRDDPRDRAFRSSHSLARR